MKLSLEQEARVVDNMRLAQAVTFRYAHNPDNRDYADIYSEALVGLYIAAKKYDPNRGLAFSTFAWVIMSQRIIALFRHAYYKPESRPASLDAVVSEQGDAFINTVIDRKTDMVNNYDVKEFLNRSSDIVLESLGPLAQRIYEMIKVNPGCSQQIIATEVGCTQPAVSRWIVRIRDCLQKAYYSVQNVDDSTPYSKVIVQYIRDLKIYERSTKYRVLICMLETQLSACPDSNCLIEGICSKVANVLGSNREAVYQQKSLLYQNALRHRETPVGQIVANNNIHSSTELLEYMVKDIRSQL